jgi:hypothetical protein
MKTTASSYWKLTRAPRYSLTFALPLLLAYEALALLLSGDGLTGVRNGADVLLKSLFVTFGGRDGLITFGVLLVGAGAVLVWRDVRTSGWPKGKVLLGMAGESVIYALAFGTVAALLTGLLLSGLPALSLAQFSRFDLPTQLMISLGAGLYEELLFRVILVSGLAVFGRVVLGWSSRAAAVFAVLVGALVFSWFHYIGPYGDPFTLGSFTFRAIAGVLFSGLYLLRGFGVTAWTHALYDVFLAL